MAMPASHKLRMLQCMILVAGVAACLSLRWTINVYVVEVRNAIHEWHASRSILLLLSRVPTLVSESSRLMSLATLTLLVLTLCPPRPRLMALARRPGFVALFAAMVPIAIVVGLDVVDHAASHWLFSSSVRINMPNRMPFNLELLINDARGLPGYSVAAAWGLLWIGRRWRSCEAGSMSWDGPWGLIGLV